MTTNLSTGTSAHHWPLVMWRLTEKVIANDIRLQKAYWFAEQIAELYDRIDPSFALLCRTTCPDCRENCCRRATVWYDQRDLLTLLLTTGHLPVKQIERSASGRCCHLGDRGCRLPRLQRPFICTWYLCVAQKQLLASVDYRASDTAMEHLEEKIATIQELRKKMERIYLDAISP